MKTVKAGELYRRKDSGFLWMWFIGADGKVRAASTKTTDEKLARKRLAAVVRRIKESVALGEDVGPLTVERYSRRWIADRKRRRIDSAGDEETRLRKHALPMLGSTLLHEVRPGHVRALVRELRMAGKLADRTIRHVYGTLHTMFEESVADELLSVNPCTLKKGELPKKRDKDPLWRSGAVFAPGEVAQLISDPRVPADRRVLYALKFFTGSRDGEVAALTWDRWDAKRKPLGCLLIAQSWSTKRRKVKSTKTGLSRQVPVHPQLAKTLAEWKLANRPAKDSLIVPNADGSHRTNSQNWKRLQKDLAVLGLRGRRSHDARRTFISLAIAAGARKDVLQWVTHSPPSDVVSDYMTLPWEALCDEVRKVSFTVDLRSSESEGKTA